MSDLERVNEEVEEVKENIKYKIITLQNEEESNSSTIKKLMDQLNEELEKISVEFRRWCEQNTDPLKVAQRKEKIMNDVDRLVALSKEKIDKVKENEDLMNKLEQGKDKIKNVSDTVLETIDNGVQDVLTNPTVAKTIDTVSDKIVDVIQDERVQQGINQARRTTLKVAENALAGLKKVLKADELDREDEAINIKILENHEENN